MAGETYEAEIKVRFADVDDARVVYYPQVPRLLPCRAFEEWMEDGTRQAVLRHVSGRRQSGTRPST